MVIINLASIKQFLAEHTESEARMKILFVEKNGTKYKSFGPEISNEVQKKIISLFLETVSNREESGVRQVPYNPSGHEVDECSTCSTSYVGNFNEVINLFDESQEEEISPDKISFIIFRLRVNNNNEPSKFIYFFRKNHKLKNIRKGFWMRKVSETYNVLDNAKLVGIDGEIDAISFDDELLFFSHIAAERIFNLREKFTENAVEVLEKVKEGNKINNFDQFEQDCLDDARVKRRLTKIHSNPRILELFHAHFDNATEVVELFDLNISFNDDASQIIYEDKEQLTDITMLMRDAYYRTVLADRKGIDDFN